MEKSGTSVTNTKARKQKKRNLTESDDVSSSMPKRAESCTNFKENSVLISEEAVTVETKEQEIVEDEIVALHLTSEETSEARQTRNLTDFFLHDSDGAPQPVEMSEIKDIFIGGVILPLEITSSDKYKEFGVRCQSFGRVEYWNIAGYEDGSPVIWISTNLADYECLKPATNYKKIYDYFFDKASASVAVYKNLSKSSGGNPDTSLDELLVAVVRSMREIKSFSSGTAIHEFVISEGEFIYNQLARLDEIAWNTDAKFAEMPSLVTLRDEKAMQMEGRPSIGPLRIGGVSEQLDDGADEDRKYAKILQDEENRKSMQRPRKNSSSARGSKNFYIKIEEERIANDYPLNSFYTNSEKETDELMLSDAEVEAVIDELPCRILQNWALYNSDMRFVSLELLPMKPYVDIDVNIYGSGVVTEDDGTWFNINDSESSTQEHGPDGITIFLSQIKEWMIEFRAGMISASFRTDMAWYRLGKPSKLYAPWYKPVMKTARVAVRIITLLHEQTTVSSLSFLDVTKRLSELEESDDSYISSKPNDVERYVVVHGQIIFLLFAEYPNQDIMKSLFIFGLASRMKDRRHTRWVINKNKNILKGLNSNPMTRLINNVPEEAANDLENGEEEVEEEQGRL